MVGAVSEVAPLRTEEMISENSEAVDDLSGVEAKTTTTVALDFGRITINPELILYIFGTPGQERFWFMWDELSRGALGAIVLADTRRLDELLRGGRLLREPRRRLRGSRELLRRRADVHRRGGPRRTRPRPRHPIRLCDARDRESCKAVLLTLLEHLMRRAHAQLGMTG